MSDNFWENVKLIDIFFRRMTDVLLPMYEREFKGGICLKYIGNRLVEGDLEKLKEFEKFFDGLEECNVKKIFDEMKEDVKDEKWTAEKVFFMDELIEKIQVVGVLYNDITLEMGAWLDKNIEEVIVITPRLADRRLAETINVYTYIDRYIHLADT